MGNQNGYTAIEIAMVILIGFGISGWLVNFQNLFQYDWPSRELIVSIVGIFLPPLGVITGWIW